MSRNLYVPLVLLLVFVSPLVAAETNHAKGLLTVDGKPVILSRVYAYKTQGDVIVVFCDAPQVPNAPSPADLKDFSARPDLIQAGKLHCVQAMINPEKQIINYKVEHNRFSHTESGGSTEHVFEARDFDAQNISGRIYTKSPQKSFDDILYSYDVAFNANIATN